MSGHFFVHLSICPNKCTKSHPGQILSHAERQNLSRQNLSCPAFCWTNTNLSQQIWSFCLFVRTNRICPTNFVVSLPHKIRGQTNFVPLFWFCQFVFLSGQMDICTNFVFLSGQIDKCIEFVFLSRQIDKCTKFVNLSFCPDKWTLSFCLLVRTNGHMYKCTFVWTNVHMYKCHFVRTK